MLAGAPLKFQKYPVCLPLEEGPFPSMMLPFFTSLKKRQTRHCQIRKAVAVIVGEGGQWAEAEEQRGAGGHPGLGGPPNQEEVLS